MPLLKTLTEKFRKKQSSPEKKAVEPKAGKTEPASHRPKTARASKTLATGLYSSVLKKAHVTEKSARGVANRQYVFNVSGNANKSEIKKAVMEIYGIKPLSVNCIIMKGKKVRAGKMRGKRKDVKKAIVTLPKGKHISLYEGV
ncbi:MAG: 50S ribosomal protein L23 [Candidatus Jacksonbacteria bacterium]|nr:50S ribosomal protein L23 [Candidatus Jacksonbacteria bacterium]